MAILPQDQFNKNKYTDQDNFLDSVTDRNNLELPNIPYEHPEAFTGNGGILPENGTDIGKLDTNLNGLATYSTLTYDKISSRATETQTGVKVEDFRHDVRENVTRPETDNKKILNQFSDSLPGEKLADPTLSTHIVDPIMKANDIDDFVRLLFIDKRDDSIYQFRSYFNGFSDKWNSNWVDAKYIGRPNPLKLFSQVTRDISFEFYVPALGRGELKLMYQKLESLAKLTMPTGVGVMIAPVIEFTLGDWFTNELAHITSLSYSIDNEFPWEVNVEKNLTDEAGELPQIVKVSMGIYIIGKTVFDAANYNIFGVHDKFGIK